MLKMSNVKKKGLWFFVMHQSDFLSPGTVKVKSSGIQVGDLIIVEKVGLLISSVIVGN